MQLRRFGATDLEVSPICFGPMRFAAKDGTDDDASRAGRRALERALERGVNFVHSSYEYGTRWSVSKVLAGHPRRHEIHHVIKVPVPDFDDGGRFDAAKFRLRVEEALAELHTDRIAVIQHLQRAAPNDDEPRIAAIDAVDEPLRETFETLREEGKVGYLTSFPYTPGFAQAALATGTFSGLVAYYNAVELEMARFFPALEQSGGGFLCIRPFLAGLLTDRRADREALPAGDRMLDPSWDAAYRRLAVLRERLQPPSVTAFAVRFALAHPIVASMIVGLNTVEQVDEVIDAAAEPAPRSAFDEALALFDDAGPVTTG
jgi:aryl-alcohol dehydrogenase-like predicted oxidoreductase